MPARSFVFAKISFWFPIKVTFCAPSVNFSTNPCAKGHFVVLIWQNQRKMIVAIGAPRALACTMCIMKGVALYDVTNGQRRAAGWNQSKMHQQAKNSPCPSMALPKLCGQSMHIIPNYKQQSQPKSFLTLVLSSWHPYDHTRVPITLFKLS